MKLNTTTMLLLGVGAYLLYQYAQSHPGTIPGMGRVYLSGMGGMGTIGEGYNINEQVGGDASRSEQATKLVM